MRIKLASPQAAQLGIFYRKISNVAPLWGTWLRTHYWLDREEKKKAQHPTGFESMTSLPWGICSTAVLHPLPTWFKLVIWMQFGEIPPLRVLQLGIMVDGWGWNVEFGIWGPGQKVEYWRVLGAVWNRNDSMKYLGVHSITHQGPITRANKNWYYSDLMVI